MNVDLEYYKVFYYVAKNKKISLAADKLFVSQPAVTQTIQKLEDLLGTTLLVRTKAGIELTESGKMLYDFISENVEILDNVEYKFSKYEKLEQGIIRIRTGSNVAKLILYDAIEKFGKDYPNVQIEIATGNPNQSIKLLHTGEVDMVLTYLPCEQDYANLKITECKKEEYIFAMSKKYYKDNKVEIKTIDDLNNYSLILPKKNSTIRNMFDKKWNDKIKNYHYEVAQEQMKKEFILRDMGIGFIVKDEIKDELESGKIIEVRLKDAKINGAIGAITMNKKIASFATKRLLEYMI